jgi:hypothetical protein
MLRRILLAASFVLGLSPALAQVPPPVPALPDTQRLTTYSISASTCACAVGFALYGDGTDVDNWMQVYIGTTRYLSTDPTFGWTLTSPTGPLGNIARPITDGILTFNSPQTGNVSIYGARRPRRTTQFQENRGVTARDLNQVITDVVAQNREEWDRLTSFFGGFQGNRSGTTNTFATISGTPVSGSCVSWDGSGNLVTGAGPCVSSGSGVSAGTINQIAFYASTGSTVAGNAATLTSTGTMTLAPTAGNQGYVANPAAYTALLPSGFRYNEITQGSDGVHQASPNSNTFTSLLRLNLIINSAATGEKFAIDAFTGHDAVGAITGGDLGGGNFSALAERPNGGTNLGAGAAGTSYGIGTLGQLGCDGGGGCATNYTVASGAELDAAINTGASAQNRWGVSTVALGNVQGSLTDAAYEIGALSTPFQTGLLIDNIHSGGGLSPITSTGFVIGSDGSGNTIGGVIDLHTYAFTSAIFNFQNAGFVVTNHGDTYVRHLTGITGSPTANSCPGFAVVTGSHDLQGSATMSSATSCSVNFGIAIGSGNAANCVVSPGSAVSTTQVTATANGFAVTFGTAQTAFSWVCFGV